MLKQSTLFGLLLSLAVITPAAADDFATYQAKLSREPAARAALMNVNLDSYSNIRSESQANAMVGADVPGAAQQAMNAVKRSLPTASAQPPNIGAPVFHGNGTTYRSMAEGLPSGSGIVVIATNDAPGTVIEWYRAQLRSGGWQVKEVNDGTTSGYSAMSFRCMQGDRYCNVHVSGKSTAPAFTTIQVSVGKRSS